MRPPQGPAGAGVAVLVLGRPRRRGEEASAERIVAAGSAGPARGAGRARAVRVRRRRRGGFVVVYALDGLPHRRSGSGARSGVACALAAACSSPEIGSS